MFGHISHAYSVFDGGTMTPRMPEADQFGFVKTFNNTGYMTTYLDDFSQSWVDHVHGSTQLNADIGAAYGVATLAALKNRTTKVIAIDLDKEHLNVLSEKAQTLGIANQLQTVAADFPHGLETIKDNSLDNVLICRVLHFFNGEKLQEAMNWCYKKMLLNGKLFLVNETPYLRNFQTFIPIYEQRKKQGVPFPGFIEDVKSIAPERAKFLPPQMHLLDEEVLSRVCKNAGFKIERTAIIPRPNFPLDIQLDGRESVGVIACKMK